MLLSIRGRNPMQIAISLFFLAASVLSLPFAAASCFSGIGLLDKTGFRLLAHFSVFFVTLTAPLVLLVCAVESFFWGTFYMSALLASYAAVGFAGAAVDNAV